LIEAPGREREPSSVSRKVEPLRAANVVDSEEVVVKCFDHALDVGAVRPELAHVGDSEDGQGLRGVVPPDRGLQGVLGVEVAIVGNQDEVLGLTDVPDLQVG
jgi:hypothetical protein